MSERPVDKVSAYSEEGILGTSDITPSHLCAHLLSPIPCPFSFQVCFLSCQYYAIALLSFRDTRYVLDVWVHVGAYVQDVRVAWG